MATHRVGNYNVEIVHVEPDEKGRRRLRVTILATNGVDVVSQVGGVLMANELNQQFLQAIIPGGSDIPISEFAAVMQDIRVPTPPPQNPPSAA